MTIALSPQHSTSPLRSSPLSKPPWPPTNKAAKRRSLASSPGNGRGLPVPSLAASAGSSTGSASSLSRSHPLLGSYPLSLLHARMSAHAPHSVPSFSLRIRAIGSSKCPADTPQSVRAPPPLDLPFKATYYDLADGINTPWVADVDLEGWFFSSYGGARTSGDPSGLGKQNERSASLGSSPAPAPTSEEKLSSLPSPPHYPGYRVPQIGQLQILVRTAASPIKVFVIPYDLGELPVGGRLLARERMYVSSGNSATAPSASPSNPAVSQVANGTGESLRYAVQLQFTCMAEPDGGRAFYVARTLKLVFASRAPESSETVRDERADEVVPPSGTSDPRVDEWMRVRRKYVNRPNHMRLPAPVRGFSPSRDRPRTPAAIASPRSLLSALDPRGEPEEERNAAVPILGASIATALLAPTAKPATQTGFLAEETDGHSRGTSPRPPSVADNRRRRGSRAERELSERLRAMEIRN